MRRKDREITDREEMLAVIRSCDVIRLALNDEEGYPYILPLNFGMTDDGETITFYFHGAAQGTKYEKIAKDNRASFEMDCHHDLIYKDESKTCTMDYESIIGRGEIFILSDEEKMEALKRIMEHYYPGGREFKLASMAHTTVMKLVVTQMTGKRHGIPYAAKHPEA